MYNNIRSKREAQRLYMIEDMKEGQPEFNTLDQKKGWYSETEDPDQTLKNLIRLWRPSDSEDHQTQK